MNTNIQLSPHFNLREFLHPGAEKELTVDIIENLRKLAQKLELIREYLGDVPIRITSGFRTAKHNMAIGGARQSQHMVGLAADFVVPGMSDKYVQARLAQVKDKIGFCLEITNGKWTHIDLRSSNHVFENLGGGKYKTLNVVEIKDFIRKHGKAA